MRVRGKKRRHYKERQSGGEGCDRERTANRENKEKTRSGEGAEGAGGVGSALNYAAYAKCQLSWGDKEDTRVAHISVEISNDTLRVLRSGATQERRNVTVSRVRVRGVTGLLRIFA